MPVHMQSQVRRFTFNQSHLKRSVRAILSDVGEASAELGILFVGDQRMRSLNRQYRGKDRTTDVLAFAMREARMPYALRQAQGRPVPLMPDMLGDVVISAPTACNLRPSYIICFGLKKCTRRRKYLKKFQRLTI